MAKAPKFDTIEEAAEAMGIPEINDQNKPFLLTFVKKSTNETSSQRKKHLLEEAAGYGLDGLDEAVETVDSLKLRICQFLYNEARFEDLDEFAGRNNLGVDHEDGRVYRIKAAVKPIEQRNAGSKEGTVGYNTIALLQDEEYADLSVAELVEKFSEINPEQKTTAPSIQWYINYCRKKDIPIVERKRASRAKADADSAGDGKVFGAELTLEKALAPKNFKKKKKAEDDPEGGLDGDLLNDEGLELD